YPAGLITYSCPETLDQRLLFPEMLRDVLVDLAGGGDVGIGPGLVAILLLGQPAAVKRGWHVGSGVQCGAIVLDRAVPLAFLQPHIAPAVERRGVFRGDIERGVAILERVV